MESRQFRRADGVLGVGFIQSHTGREVAAIAWPDVEPRRIELIDLAGHGIKLVPIIAVNETTEISVDSLPYVWPEPVINIPDTVTPEEQAELVKSADIVEPVEPTEPLHMAVPEAHVFYPGDSLMINNGVAEAIPASEAEPEVAVEVANDPPGMAG